MQILNIHKQAEFTKPIAYRIEWYIMAKGHANYFLQSSILFILERQVYRRVCLIRYPGEQDSLPPSINAPC